MKSAICVVLFAIAATYFLAGCSKDESFYIYGVEDGLPVFCASPGFWGGCDKSGRWYSTFTVAETDDQGSWVRNVWEMESIPDQGMAPDLSIVKYGVPPRGWRNTTPPLSLVKGVVYEVNSGGSFFIDGKGRYCFLSNADFVSKNKTEDHCVGSR